MAAAAEVIGVVSGVLGIFSFLQDNFAGSDNPNSKLRVVVGLDGTQGLENAGGGAPDVRLFNENLGFLGAAYDPGFITSGTNFDITIDQSEAQQPTFALLTGNDDAICIAYLSQTWPDDQKFGWVGNWGRQCGKSWYYSNIFLAGSPDPLDCTWLDSNGDATDVTAFHVHFPEFNDKGQGYNTDVNYYCNNVRTLNWQYTEDPGTIYVKRTEEEGPLSYPTSRVYQGAKNARGQRKYKDYRLIKSSAASHSATELCASETSAGPSFVSLHEGVFCDMDSKQTMPLCGGEHTDCFDVETLSAMSGGVKRGVMSFSDVLEWNADGSVGKVLDF